MPKEYSPFTPGIPVPIEFFVGRIQEVERILESAGRSVAQKSLERLFVCGERGIGKSSLCKFAITLAERNLSVIGLHVFLGGVNTLEEMTRRIFERLLNESIERPWYESVKQFLGNHVKQVGMFGITVEFDAPEKDLTRAVNDFVPALRNLLRQISGQRHGILLVLDDLNGLAASDRFANWLKSLVDEIATGREPLPLTLVLVGLPERRRQLIELQPSLDRVFDVVLIEKFSREETIDFFKRAFNRVGVVVSDDALGPMWLFSGGYPVFMHEIGDAVFRIDADNSVDGGDVFRGVIRAAEVIGTKYIEPKISNAIRSDKYRSILKKIARTPVGQRIVRKDEVTGLDDEEKKVFDNFIRRMKELGVIRDASEGGRGNYEFTREIYSLYFWMQTPGDAARSGERIGD
jgi:hypothetical protein